MNHSQNDYISYKKQINIKTFTEIHSREILIKIENSNICSSEHTNLNDVICIFHLSDKRVLNKNTGDVIDKSKKKKKLATISIIFRKTKKIFALFINRKRLCEKVK